MKPTYKISASLLNSYIYYINNPSPSNLESFKDRLKNVFVTNFFLERGLRFEDEVFEGKHGKLSELVKDLPKQVWASKTIEREDYNIKISGKMDVIDESKKRIYDIKRVSKFTEDKYDTSSQHVLYFYLRPEMTDFYYLVASGKDDDIVSNVAHYLRPDDLELEATVINMIDNFYNFLRQSELWEVYAENQKTKGYSKEENK